MNKSKYVFIALNQKKIYILSVIRNALSYDYPFGKLFNPINSRYIFILIIFLSLKQCQARTLLFILQKKAISFPMTQNANTIPTTALATINQIGCNLGLYLLNANNTNKQINCFQLNAENV